MFRYFEYSRVTEGGEIRDLIVPGKVEANVLSFGGNDFIVSVSGETTDIDAMSSTQPDSIGFTEIQQDVFELSASQSMQVLLVQDRAEEMLNGLVAQLSSEYPDVEQKTWPFQLEEARAFLETGNDVDAPMLAILAAAENDTVANFANAVIAKNTAYRQSVGQALAQKRAFVADELAKLGIGVIQ